MIDSDHRSHVPDRDRAHQGAAPLVAGGVRGAPFHSQYPTADARRRQRQRQHERRPRKQNQHRRQAAKRAARTLLHRPTHRQQRRNRTPAHAHAHAHRHLRLLSHQAGHSQPQPRTDQGADPSQVGDAATPEHDRTQTAPGAAGDARAHRRVGRRRRDALRPAASPTAFQNGTRHPRGGGQPPHQDGEGAHVFQAV